MNLREAWAKRRYEAHFVSKLTDCDGESNETDTSLDFARDCGYLSDSEHKDLAERNRAVGRMLGSMIKNPKPFVISEQSSEVTGRKSDPTSDFRSLTSES